jgi:hypothetical protein
MSFGSPVANSTQMRSAIITRPACAIPAKCRTLEQWSSHGPFALETSHQSDSFKPTSILKHLPTPSLRTGGTRIAWDRSPQFGGWQGYCHTTADGARELSICKSEGKAVRYEAQRNPSYMIMRPPGLPPFPTAWSLGCALIEVDGIMSR